MKTVPAKIFLLLLPVLAGVGLASCSNEKEDVTENCELSFDVTLPDDASTRALGEGSNLNTLVVGVFDSGLTTQITTKTFAVESGSFGDVTLTLGRDQTYNLVFWAYDSNCGVYDISNMSAITMTGGTSTTLAAADCADAFFATVKSLTVTGSATMSVALSRPLAQINVGTSGTAVSNATFTVKAAANVFNPFEGSISGSEDLTWSFTGSETETFTANSVTYNYIAMAYVFATGAEADVTCELTVGTDGTATEIPGVTICANYRSNIVGAFTE